MRVLSAVLVALVACGVALSGTFPGRDGLVVLVRAPVDGAPSLVTLDPATGAQTTLGPGTEPAWSADGSKLAFVRGFEVFVSNADGSGATVVGAGLYPSWSPDGTQLAVSRSDGAHLQVFVLDAATGLATQVTSGAVDATLPAWSPDGSTIAFATPGGLATVPAGGGATTAVSLPTTPTGGPSWSPGGDLLAFLDTAAQVWVTRPDGSGAHQVSYTLVGSAEAMQRPAWSPDGGAIAWTSGPDICVTRLNGAVTRVTRSAPTAPATIASLPDWQPSTSGAAPIAAPPQAATDAVACDWNPGVRVEILDANVSPALVQLGTSQKLVFVNHLARPLTVATTMHGARATVDPGRAAMLAVQPGEWEYAVTGYPDGVPRRGSFVVAAAGTVTAEQHAAIRYGDSTVLTGAATGAAGATITISAKPYGAQGFRRLATMTPTGGRWRLAVSPKITTLYTVTYGGSSAQRRLRVQPALVVRRGGTTVRATLAPARPLAGRRLYLFRLAADGWDQASSARAPGHGAAVFAHLAPGRYYVGFEGRADYWGAASEPFTVRR